MHPSWLLLSFIPLIAYAELPADEELDLANIPYFSMIQKKEKKEATIPAETPKAAQPKKPKANPQSLPQQRKEPAAAATKPTPKAALPRAKRKPQAAPAAKEAPKKEPKKQIAPAPGAGRFSKKYDLLEE